MAIAAIILAAGLSSRFGAAKLLQPIQGKPMLRHTVDAAIASKAAQVIVVTGNTSPEIQTLLSGISLKTVINSDPASGLSSSLKLGIENVGDCDGAVVLLGDMPFVQPATIDKLIDGFDPTHFQEIGMPLFRGQRGNPILWSRRFFPEIAALEGDRGAKALIEPHRTFLYEVEVDDPGVHIDIDTMDDLHRYE
jgi:molybdenum cofactor cytidylyltransferase